MPFISTSEVKEKRNAIKKAFPKFKFSIRCEHYSSIAINVLSGPINLGTEYEQVNQFYIDEHYENEPEKRKLLSGIYEIANRDNGTEVIDSDYGTVPNFYVHLSIGCWDKPYKVIK